MKKQMIFLALPMCITLSGCSNAEDYLEAKMMEQSKIQERSEYQTYQEYSEQGKLDQQGYYLETISEDESSADDKTADTAHIVFAKNNCLDVEYFADADFHVSLNEKSCNPTLGDKIYAKVTVNQSVASSMYSFGGFYIYQYRDGNRERIKKVVPREDGFIMSVSSDEIGADLSIEPIGIYEKRNLSLEDYYKDDNDEAHELLGTWFIDNRETTDEQIEINPVSPYTISYEYDNDEYFYVNASPKPYYCNDADGIVIFPQKEAQDETENYSVELHQYVTFDVSSDQPRKVSINEEEQNVKAGDVWKTPKLKYGDKIIVETDKEWEELANSRELVSEFSESKDGKYKYTYTVTVPQKGGTFVFNPTEYTYEHGKITFECFGKTVTTTQYLAKGHKIAYKAEADEGWRLKGENNYITVEDEDTTKENLRNIQFIESILVDVALEQPESGGKITYFVDNKELTGNSCRLYAGTLITMDFSPWEGWINNYKNGEIYTVTDKKSQTVSFGSKGVNDAFVEDDAHKPMLEVVLDKSVGENMQFEFEASGLKKDDYQYEDGWFRRNYTVIKPLKIGTEKGITVSMGNRALQSGTAVKIAVERTDTDKNKVSEYRLINDLTRLEEPILIYEHDEMGKSTTWYKNIKITISIVDVLTCRIPELQMNAEVNVKNASTMKALKQGDILEGDEKVFVTIIPSNGYYVSGKDTKNGIYQNTMKFSKYLSDVDQIIEKHPVMKYYRIILDKSDVYGKCSYSLDGKTVNGSILVKEGQKLTLEYVIEQPGYVIEGAKGIMFGIGKNNQKKTESIVITPSIDGQTINRETFGISVIKGE